MKKILGFVSLLATFFWILMLAVSGGYVDGLGSTISGAAAPADGMVVGLQPGTTLWIMDMARQSKVGFYVFQNPAWPDALLWVGRVQDNGIGFVLQNAPAEIVTKIGKCGGNLGNCRTIVEFVSWARRMGWTAIDPASLSPSVVAALDAAIHLKNTGHFAAYSEAVISSGFVFVPGEFIDPMFVLENYAGYTPPGWQ